MEEKRKLINKKEKIEKIENFQREKLKEKMSETMKRDEKKFIENSRNENRERKMKRIEENENIENEEEMRKVEVKSEENKKVEENREKVADSIRGDRLVRQEWKLIEKSSNSRLHHSPIAKSANLYRTGLDIVVKKFPKEKKKRQNYRNKNNQNDLENPTQLNENNQFDKEI